MITILRWFDQVFNCLSVKTDTNKNRFNLIYSEGSKAYKTQLAAAWLPMWLNHCEFDVIWTAFQGFWIYILTFQHFGFLMNFRDFQVFVFGYRVYNGHPEIMENLYFLLYNTPMHVNLCFYHYFNCLNVKLT